MLLGMPGIRAVRLGKRNRPGRLALVVGMLGRFDEVVGVAVRNWPMLPCGRSTSISLIQLQAYSEYLRYQIIDFGADRLEELRVLTHRIGDVRTFEWVYVSSVGGELTYSIRAVL